MSVKSRKIETARQKPAESGGYCSPQPQLTTHFLSKKHVRDI
jgi:hypothetical protein